MKPSAGTTKLQTKEKYCGACCIAHLLPTAD